VIDHKPDIYSDAGYLLNEGGGILVQKNGKLYTVSVTEKTPLWLRLTATGPAGHAAVPPADSAVTRLVAALDRLDSFRTPIRVINPVRDYFHTLATLGDAPVQFSDLAAALRNDPAFARNFVAVPGQNAQVRDTITPTVLHGSDKTNTIPAVAYAEIDCRLLPGTDKKDFLATIRKVIADKSIKVDVLLNFPPASSPSKSLLMNAIRIVAQRFDKAPAVPRLLDGFTDSHYFRQKGVIAYGFIPLEITPAEMHEVHGVNERIAIKNLEGGMRRMVDLLEILGGREGQ
jgi:acetylornithine deacetylase/succinyl-diaminopimelate desuccinylase-like protein